MTVETAAAQAVRGALTEGSRLEAARDAHKLVGTLGTFGHHAGSDAARRTERLLKQQRPDAHELAAAAVDLRAEVDQIIARTTSGATRTPAPEPAPEQPAWMRAKEQCDVAVVDDDETLAALIVQTLQGRRISARWIDGAGDVLGILCGPDRVVEPRVILLDVDMPGLDGLRILRVLRGDPVTARVKVIMLTVRASEPEVLAALRLGAIDHVAKPFSLRILLQKIERALSP